MASTDGMNDLFPLTNAEVIYGSYQRAPSKFKQRVTLHNFAFTLGKIDEFISSIPPERLTSIILEWWGFHGNVPERGPRIAQGLPETAHAIVTLHVYLRFWQLKLLLTQRRYFRLDPHPYITEAYAFRYYLFFKALCRMAELRGWTGVLHQFSPDTLKKFEEGLLNYTWGDLRILGNWAHKKTSEKACEPLRQGSMNPWERAFALTPIYESLIEHGKHSESKPEISFVHLGLSEHIYVTSGDQKPKLESLIFTSAIGLKYISANLPEEHLRWVIDPSISAEPLPMDFWHILVRRRLYLLGLKREVHLSFAFSDSNLPPSVHDILGTRTWGEVEGKSKPVFDPDPILSKQKFQERVFEKLGLTPEAFAARSRLYYLFYQHSPSPQLLSPFNAVHREEEHVFQELTNKTTLIRFSKDFLQEMASWIASLELDPAKVVEIYAQKLQSETTFKRPEIAFMEAISETHLSPSSPVLSASAFDRGAGKGESIVPNTRPTDVKDKDPKNPDKLDRGKPRRGKPFKK